MGEISQKNFERLRKSEKNKPLKVKNAKKLTYKFDNIKIKIYNYNIKLSKKEGVARPFLQDYGRN